MPTELLTADQQIDILQKFLRHIQMNSEYKIREIYDDLRTYKRFPSDKGVYTRLLNNLTPLISLVGNRPSIIYNAKTLDLDHAAYHVLLSLVVYETQSNNINPYNENTEENYNAHLDACMTLVLDPRIVEYAEDNNGYSQDLLSDQLMEPVLSYGFREEFSVQLHEKRCTHLVLNLDKIQKTAWWISCGLPSLISNVGNIETPDQEVLRTLFETTWSEDFSSEPLRVISTKFDEQCTTNLILKRSVTTRKDEWLSSWRTTRMDDPHIPIPDLIRDCFGYEKLNTRTKKILKALDWIDYDGYATEYAPQWLQQEFGKSQIEMWIYTLVNDNPSYDCLSDGIEPAETSIMQYILKAKDWANPKASKSTNGNKANSLLGREDPLGELYEDLKAFLLTRGLSNYEKFGRICRSLATFLQSSHSLSNALHYYHSIEEGLISVFVISQALRGLLQVYGLPRNINTLAQQEPQVWAQAFDQCAQSICSFHPDLNNNNDMTY